MCTFGPDNWALFCQTSYGISTQNISCFEIGERKITRISEKCCAVGSKFMSGNREEWQFVVLPSDIEEEGQRKVDNVDNVVCQISGAEFDVLQL